MPDSDEKPGEAEESDSGAPSRCEVGAGVGGLPDRSLDVSEEDFVILEEGSMFSSPCADPNLFIPRRSSEFLRNSFSSSLEIVAQDIFGELKTELAGGVGHHGPWSRLTPEKSTEMDLESSGEGNSGLFGSSEEEKLCSFLALRNICWL